MLHGATCRCSDLVFHLHGLEYRQATALLDTLAFVYRNLRDPAMHGCQNPAIGTLSRIRCASSEEVLEDPTLAVHRQMNSSFINRHSVDLGYMAGQFKANQLRFASDDPHFNLLILAADTVGSTAVGVDRQIDSGLTARVTVARNQRTGTRPLPEGRCYRDSPRQSDVALDLVVDHGGRSGLFKSRYRLGEIVCGELLIDERGAGFTTVSYTNLTLPTILLE